MPAAPTVLRMTIDTNCVIHAVQQDKYVAELAELVALAQAGRLGLSLTGAFEVDMERAKERNLASNLEWLRARPVIERIPQPFRFDFSPFSDPGHGFMAGPAQAAAVEKLEAILLREELRPGAFDPAEKPALQTEFRRKVADVQHLGGHLMSGNDYFVTTDERDMLKKKSQIFAATAIRVVDPVEAVTIARAGAAPST